MMIDQCNQADGFEHCVEGRLRRVRGLGVRRGRRGEVRRRGVEAPREHVEGAEDHEGARLRWNLLRSCGT